MKKFLTILVFLSVFNLANAGYESETNQGGWVYKDGTSVPNSDSMKSIKGFGGWLVVTPDADWEEKWNTPPDTTPNFTVASEVNYGEELTILPFYINPKLNSRGEANVLCDIKITRPDGSNAIDVKDIECASGKLQGNPPQCSSHIRSDKIHGGRRRSARYLDGGDRVDGYNKKCSCSVKNAIQAGQIGPTPCS